MKISIIIPVYNVAKYVGRCLDSVFLQTYPNIECLIVDDCGSDNSMEIVRHKLAYYTGSIDFKIITHKENRGLPAARNTGIENAQGEYIAFLDSDDWIEENSFCELSAILQQHKPDMLCFEYRNIDETGDSKVNNKEHYTKECVIYSGFEFFSEVMRYRQLVMSWLYVSNRQFLNENNLRFMEGVYHEDEEFTPRAVCLAKTILYWDRPIYQYFLREGSIMRSQHLLAKRIISYEKVSLSLQRFSTSQPMPPIVKALLASRISTIAIKMAYSSIDLRDIDLLRHSLDYFKKSGIKLFPYSINCFGIINYFRSIFDSIKFFSSITRFRIKNIIFVGK